MRFWRQRISAGLLVFLLSASLLTACRKTDGTTVQPSEANTVNTADIASLSKVQIPEITKEDNEQEIDTATATKIVFSDGTATVSGAGAAVSGNRVTVKTGGTYLVTGSTADGQLLVDAADTDTVKLVLQNANIQSASGAAIYVQNAGKTILNAAKDTVNRLTDAAQYSGQVNEEPDSAVYSKDDLTVNGKGTLKISGNYNDALKSNDTLTVTGAMLEVTGVDDGLVGKDFVLINGGNITVNVAGDGIKSTYDTDTAKGAIVVSGGSLQITAGADGLQAQTEIRLTDGDFTVTTGGGSTAVPAKTQSQNPMGGTARDSAAYAEETAQTSESYKGIKCGCLTEISGGTYRLDCADDAVHCNNTIVISGGALTVQSGDDGIHADTLLSVSGGTIDVQTSYEGLESTQIDIADGNISLVASDDGINAAGGNDASAQNGRFGGDPFAGSTGTLNITGGTIYVNASGDGLDSNGDIYQSGGTVTVDGPTDNGNGALDYSGAYKMTGGTLVAAGTAGMAMTISENSTVYAVTVGANIAANTAICISEENGKEVLSFVLQKPFQTAVVATPAFEKGKTYTVSSAAYSGGALSGGILSGAVFSDVTEIGSFTANSILSTVGTVGGMQGGENPQFGGENPQFGGENPQFGGENPQFGGGNPQFGGENPQFGGERPVGGLDTGA